MKFSVMTFNLRYWNEEDGENAWPYRKDQVADLIKSYAPLVLGIQEGLYSMLLDLDSRLNNYARVGDGRLGGNESEFSAIYYQKDLLDVKEVKQIWLSETPQKAASKSWDSSLCRICTWALFETKQTKEQFLLFNTHLDHRGEIARLEGAKLILSHMEPYMEKGYGAILTGDFNCTPESEPIQYIRKYLVDAAQKQGKEALGTFHNFTGRASSGPIDYIFVAPTIRVEDVQVLADHQGGRYPSDHFPVLATIEI